MQCRLDGSYPRELLLGMFYFIFGKFCLVSCRGTNHETIVETRARWTPNPRENAECAFFSFFQCPFLFSYLV
jgi:hypothetical protein